MARRIMPCPCRKLTPGHIGGAVRPILVRPRSDRRSGRRGGSARPSAMTSACAPRCSIFDTISADDADAARQTQRHDQGNPAGSIRSASPHIHSAMVSVVRSVDLVCPSLEVVGQRHRRPGRCHPHASVSCRAIHSALGCAVTPSHISLRRLWCRIRNPNNSRNEIVGTRNRSIDAMPSA
jgi:hypothetical protein